MLLHKKTKIRRVFFLVNVRKNIKITKFLICPYLIDNDYRLAIDFTIFVVYNERQLNSDNRYQ